MGKDNPLKESEKKVAIQQKKSKVQHSTITFSITDSKGKEKWLEDSITPISNKAGQIQFIFGIIRDITEIRNKEKEINQKWLDYKNLLDLSPLAFIIHKNGKCLLCNKTTVILTKSKTEKDLIGKSIFNYIKPNQLTKAKARSKKVSKGQELDFVDYNLIDKKGNEINVKIKTVPIVYNGENCQLSLVKDVSQQEKYERSIIRAEIIEEHNKKLLREIRLRKNAEEQSKDFSNRLEVIFNTSDYLVWTVNSNYEFTYFNSNFKAHFVNKYKTEPKTLKTGKELVGKKYKENYEKAWWGLYDQVLAGNNIKKERFDQDGLPFVWEVFMSPIKLNNQVVEVSCIAKNITENHQIKVSAEEQSARLNAIFESGTQLVWTVTKDNKYTAFNKNFKNAVINLTGEAPSPGLIHGGIKKKIYTDFWNDIYKKAFTTKKNFSFINSREYSDKEITRQYYVNLIFNKSGEATELCVIGNDITAKKESEEKSIAQAAKLNSIFEGSSHYVWIVNPKNRITSFNKNYYELIRKIYGSEPIIGEELNRGIKDNNEAYLQKLNENYLKAFEGEKQNFELDILTVDGERIVLNVFLNPVFESNKIVEVSGVAHDITQLKQNEEGLVQSLKEKEVLLKEVHHRVKNNMQIISSILNLQSSYIYDTKVLELLKESQNRIKTMAYVHESLYQNKTFSIINLSEYLSTLVNNIVQSYSVSPEKTKLIINSEKVLLNLDNAIPLGLIANELVTNAIKHAFPGKSKGVIQINLQTKNNYVFLNIEDNGIGLPPDFNPESSATLGLQLVQTLGDQITAKVEFISKQPHGTIVNISFKH
ncbi:MAG: PAS domain S-box protein [Bacteroidia bacterium]